MLVDIFALIDGNMDASKVMKSEEDDFDGSLTLNLLTRSARVVERITGNSHGSLGLHPAVYFYTERGKHSRFLFLGVVKVFSDAIRNNDKSWFKKLTCVRGALEGLLLSRKSLINQGLANVNSGQRIDRVARLIKFLVSALSDKAEITDAEILKALGLEGAAGNLKVIDAPKGFTTDVKSAAYLQSAVQTAAKCSICGGYLHTIKSASYDHVTPKSQGGLGTVENAQIVHPFCNTGIKGGK